MGAVVYAWKSRLEIQKTIAIPGSITTILQRFKRVFEEPTGLPPNRSCDHTIPLKSEDKLVNQRPYRLPYLGHIISEEGVATDSAKIKAVTKWPTPANVTQLRSFLGLTSYYRRFIQDYGVICKPLFDALKKSGFVWQEAQKSAFLTLKEVMTKAPMLALPDHSQPFTLEVDASGYGISAVLMQNQKHTAFISKALGPRAATYSTYEKEALAIIEILKKWKNYFAGSTLIIRTDQQSLRYIEEQKLTEGIRHKLLVKLLGYNYRVEYKRGRENKAADALSRCVNSEQLGVNFAVVPVWVNEIINSYDRDEFCKELITKLSIDTNAEHNYTLKGGILRYKNKVVVGTNSELRVQLILLCHDSALEGYSGDRVTYQRMKLLFHWKGMKQVVTQFVKECPTCQRNKSEHTPYPGFHS